MSKLALGTVQFGLAYGINNTRGKIPAAEAGLILNIAHAAHIDTLDTAYAYGESEGVLGQCLDTHAVIRDAFRIISKLPDLNIETDKSPEFYLAKTLARLHVKSVYGYLLHNFENIKTHHDLMQFLKNAKSEGKIGKFGFSLYHPEHAREILDDKISCDLIQIPYSVFDRRFEPLLPALKARKIEIHTRSVFLQGLFFKDPSALPEKLSKVAPKLEKLRLISAETGLKITEICLGFALLNDNIDRVLCGVDSIANIKENITAEARMEKVREIMPLLQEFKETDENILIPSNWNVQ
ncbi:MAG: aldo/keto reductase [Elusimicrobiaceae bacterium]|jgi:aryl-alcohol dehydrogenase-like predicted oxidoreductase